MEPTTMVRDWCFSCEKLTRGADHPDIASHIAVCGQCGTPYGKLLCEEHHAVMEPCGRTAWGGWTFSCDGGHVTELLP